MRKTIIAASLGTLLLAPSLVRADDPDAATAKPAAKPADAKPAAPARPASQEPAMKPAPAPEPDHITIQHVLIGFTGSVPGKNITRTMEDAKKLAHEILDRAKKGEDFDALVKKYTDDSAPGIYSMSNKGVAPAQGEYPRGGMVPAFGDAGFPLQVGEVGIAEYDKARSPYGWHVVKRIK